jgi:uncharacterized protein YcfJ
MKKTTILAAVVMALAGKGHAATDLIDTAQVISSTPIVERITEQRQECGPVSAVPAPARERGVAGPIIGGVAGAILGARIGRGNGRTAAAAAGAVAGTIVGDHVGNPEPVAGVPTQQCRTVQSARDVVRGYTVVYRYYDRDITTTLPSDPGPTVRVGVGVIDNALAAGAPTPAMRGSHVRSAGPAPVLNAPPAPVGATGGYQYLY